MNTEIHKISIRKNDTVQVIAGREKGKTGKVLRVDTAQNRITVEKINLVKRHVKPTQKNPQGGVIDKESPLHFSNVLLFCSKCNTGRRHGYKFVEQSAGKVKGKKTTTNTAGKKVKVRFCKKCGETL